MTSLRVEVSAQKPWEFDCDALAVNILEDRPFDETLSELDRRMNNRISRMLKDGEVSTKANTVSELSVERQVGSGRILVIGSGHPKDFDYERIIQIAGTATRYVRRKNVKHLAFRLSGPILANLVTRGSVVGAILGSFDTAPYRTVNREERRLARLSIIIEDEAGRVSQEREVRDAIQLAESTNIIRELVNQPGNLLTPRRLAERAVQIGKHRNLEVQVLDGKRIEKIGMRAFLAVSRGSHEPPRLVVMKYRARGRERPTLALVGKGITFDSGGISIKPSEGMHYMKFDMAGGAAVLGAMDYIGAVKPDIDVLGIVPATENLPGGGAVKPGDVVSSLDGKTIEILNTDAEGRLILADALTYSIQQGASYILDLATLTGACVVALGDLITGVMGTPQSWVDKVLKAGELAGESMWQLPLRREYSEMLKSDIADLSNIGRRILGSVSTSPAGAIVGASFLQEFIGETPWAHMDIAGTAWNDRDFPYLDKGPTGVGVRTIRELVKLLEKS